VASYASVTPRPYLRIGHKGAAALAPENTIASLGAALEHGVDMVEFDVVDAPDGTLVLAHSREEIVAAAPQLDAALTFIAERAPPSTGLVLDLKGQGFEEAIVGSLHRQGLVERALVSSFFARSLRELRHREPALRTGISYPWDRRGLATRRSLTPAIWAGVAALRAALPHRIARMVEMAEASSAMIHYSVLSAAAVARCHRLGISVFAWTVDERRLLDRVLATGVDGVISNDPRIFDARGEPRYDHVS
jgi:glycerophosphoryl diester phosphodiesterase